MLKSIPALFALLLTSSTVFSGAEEFSAGQLEFFEKHIRPVLAEKCFECHAADAEKVKGGLLLDSREGVLKGGDTGPAVVPGKLGDSLIIESIRHEDLEMPPKERLPEEVIRNFEKWVEMGAPDPREADPQQAVIDEPGIDLEKGREFWAFQEPIDGRVPKVKDATWPRAAIDSFVLGELEREGMAPVADAEALDLLRRVSFDLVGLPPTVEQIEAVSEDGSSRVIDGIIDDLLASPQYGERWGRHWLDVARYGESSGMERNFTYPEAWRYRDYVIRVFNEDRPYDQFLREQIAGDLLPANTRERRDEMLVATGFLAMGPKSLNERDKEQFRMDIVDEQIDVVMRGMLGLTASCARCHDHKFDPIAMKDYYALAGFFTSTVPYYGTGKGGGNRQPSTLMPIGEGGKDKELELRKHRGELVSLSKKLATTKKSFGKLKSRYKNKEAPPRDMVEMEEMEERMGELEDELEDLRERAPERPGYAMGAADRDEGQIGGTELRVRGNAEERGAIIARGYLPVLYPGDGPAIPEGTSGRAELAEWMVSERGRLSAKVMVNRVWHHLFGQGLVRTVDNFGTQGERPTHPELLDHLASKFVEEGWSVKSLIRYIMSSRAYRLSTAHDSKNYESDPDNRLVWRMNRRRLDAEAIRDAILSASGTLDLNPAKASVVADIGATNIGRDAKDLERLRKASTDKRSVYLPIVRNIVPDLLQNFDFAEPSILVGRRNVTTVPTQALYMMNSNFVLTQAKRMAERVLLAEKGRDRQLETLYQLTLGRAPTGGEIAASSRFLDDLLVTLAESGRAEGDAEVGAWTGLSQAMIASAEFRYLD
jgi:hypothetical protein